jgi:uncharacterized protein
VIVPDVNLLIYAVDDLSSEHRRARRWFEGLLSGDEPVGLAWSIIVAFVRLSTRPSIFAAPLTSDAAITIVQSWTAVPNVEIIEPTARHLELMRGLLAPVGTAGNLVPDAHLAALALEYGATLASRDHDFGRFRGLKWVDPLAR